MRFYQTKQWSLISVGSSGNGVRIPPQSLEFEFWVLINDLKKKRDNEKSQLPLYKNHGNKKRDFHDFSTLEAKKISTFISNFCGNVSSNIGSCNFLSISLLFYFLSPS